MYKPPIEVFVGQLRSNQEDHIFEIIQDMNVSVDKEELIKARKYDRQQYEKGYQDGIKETVEALDAEVESSDKYIREYDDSDAQKAYNKGLKTALSICKEYLN